MRKMYALDIETDNSAGFGLDPTRSRVTAISLVGDNGTVWHGQSNTPDTEVSLLSEFLCAYRGLKDALLLTWNGGAFDWPFLTYRCTMNGLELPWSLLLMKNREPKYQPLPGYEGVYAVASECGHAHTDMAFVYKEWCVRYKVTWSLKPVARSLQLMSPVIDDLELTGEQSSGYDIPLMAAYNIRDSVITLELAKIAIASKGFLAQQFRMSADQNQSW